MSETPTKSSGSCRTRSSRDMVLRVGVAGGGSAASNTAGFDNQFGTRSSTRSRLSRRDLWSTRRARSTSTARPGFLRRASRSAASLRQSERRQELRLRQLVLGLTIIRPDQPSRRLGPVANAAGSSLLFFRRPLFAAPPVRRRYFALSGEPVGRTEPQSIAECHRSLWFCNRDSPTRGAR